MPHIKKMLVAGFVLLAANCAEPSLCGFDTCHGAKVKCVIDAPQACTEMYQLGDKCRLLAACKMSGNFCEREIEPGYEDCLTCVAECAKLDGEAALQCENGC